MTLNHEQVSEIWGSMLTSRRGELEWKEEFYPGPTDPRREPINYILMTEDFPLIDESEFSTAHLIKNNEVSYTSPFSENTGVAGLLRTADLMRLPITEPENVLLVGAMNYSGILYSDMWLNQKGWKNAKITLVDKAKIPLVTISRLIENGHLRFDREIELVQSDIRKFNPPKAPDIVLGDVLHPYMDSYIGTPKLTQMSPYEPYEDFLKHTKEIAPGAWFISRCFIPPAGRHHFTNMPQPMYKPDPDNLENAWNLLDDELKSKLDKESVLTTQGVFAGYSPATYCGLYLDFKVFRSRNIMVGPKAEKVYTRLYRRNFEELHSVTVTDKNNRKFLTFAAKIP